MTFNNNPTVSQELTSHFGGRVRVRVCGILVNDDKILLVKHDGLGPHGYYWSPPGGGLEFGETVTDCLKREFFEEAGIVVEVGHLMFVNEYINEPLHAIELFYRCDFSVGSPIDINLGQDPEHDSSSQILSAIDWMSYDSILNLPQDARHHSFKFAGDIETYLDLCGQLPTQRGHSIK